MVTSITETMGYLSTNQVLEAMYPRNAAYDMALRNLVAAEQRGLPDAVALRAQCKGMYNEMCAFLRGCGFVPVYRPPVFVAARQRPEAWTWYSGSDPLQSQAGDFEVGNGVDAWGVDYLAFMQSYTKYVGSFNPDDALRAVLNQGGWEIYLKTGITWARRSLTEFWVKSMESHEAPTHGNVGDVLLFGVLGEGWRVAWEKYADPVRGYKNAEIPRYSQDDVLRSLQIVKDALAQGRVPVAVAEIDEIIGMTATYGINQALAMSTDDFSELMRRTMTGL